MPEHDSFLDNPVNRAAVDGLLEAKLTSNGSISDQDMVKILRDGPILADIPEEQKSVVAILAASRAFEMAEDIEFMRAII